MPNWHRFHGLVWRQPSIRLQERNRPTLTVRLLVVLFAAFAWAGAAHAQQIGTAVEVVPLATGELGGTTVTLVNGDDLYEGQTITTDADGQVQILFADGTHMVLGPNSALVIERYLLRDPTTVEDLTVNILGGAFRFITGNSPHEAYTVTTPTGTIGFRGTEVDGYVDWITGFADIIVYRGAIYLCPLDTTLACIYIDIRCSVGTLDTDDAAIIRDEGIRLGLAHEVYNGQNDLLDGWRVTAPQECLDALDTIVAPTEDESSGSSPSSAPPSSSEGSSEVPPESSGSGYFCEDSYSCAPIYCEEGCGSFFPSGVEFYCEGPDGPCYFFTAYLPPEGERVAVLAPANNSAAPATAALAAAPPTGAT